ncbi:MAG: DUF3263 domain-containing protein [Sporichthyaceae bacterium]
MLTELDRRILAFEHDWFRYSGTRETAIVEVFEMSPASYFQRLARLLDEPDAYVEDPLLVNRLRRLGEQRRPHRTGL